MYCASDYGLEKHEKWEIYSIHQTLNALTIEQTQATRAAKYPYFSLLLVCPQFTSFCKTIPIKCFRFPSPSTRKVESVGRIKKNQKIISKWYNSFKLKTFFIFTEISKNMGRLCFPLKWYFEKKWVGRAMGNKTIYWDGPIIATRSVLKRWIWFCLLVTGLKQQLVSKLLAFSREISTKTMKHWDWIEFGDWFS